MSLINQLLKDIEKRRGHTEVAEGLKSSDKAPPKHTHISRRWPLILIAAILLGALVVAGERLLYKEVVPKVPQPSVANIMPAPPAGGEKKPAAARPALIRATVVASNDGARVELQFDGVITMNNSITLTNPDRLVLDLAGVNPQVHPAVVIPANQSVLTGLSYDIAPQGGLRVVLLLAAGVVGNVLQSPAPNMLIAEFRMPAVEAPPQPAPVAEVPQQPAMPAVHIRQKVRISFKENRAVLSFDAPFEYEELRLNHPSRYVVDVPDISAIGAFDATPPLDGVLGLRHSLFTEDGRLRLVFEMELGTQADVERASPRTLRIRFTRSSLPVEEYAAPVSTPTVQRTLQTTSPHKRAEQTYANGIRLLTEGKGAQAEAKFRTALGHDASLHEARLALANTLVAQRRVREAEVQLQEGLRIAPGAAQLAERYARLLVDRGDLSGAIGVLSTAPPPVELEPRYHALLAALLQRAGNHKVAANTYTALVGVKPEQGLWWAGLGISLEELRRPGAALGAYRHAAQDPRLSSDMARFVSERIGALQHLDNTE